MKSTRTVMVKDIFNDSIFPWDSIIVQPGAVKGQYENYVIREIKDVPMEITNKEFLNIYKKKFVFSKDITLDYKSLPIFKFKVKIKH